MPSPTVSDHCRAVQNYLNKANSLLESTHELARNISLAPFRIAHIQAAINDNRHAWEELNQLATALELTHADRKL